MSLAIWSTKAPKESLPAVETEPAVEQAPGGTFSQAPWNCRDGLGTLTEIRGRPEDSGIKVGFNEFQCFV